MFCFDVHQLAGLKIDEQGREEGGGAHQSILQSKGALVQCLQGNWFRSARNEKWP